MNKAPWKSGILDLMTRERATLVGYVRHFIDDTAERDSEDIVQDVALNMFNRADITVPIENITSYAYQALRNKIVDYLRRRRDVISLDEDWLEDGEVSLLDLLQDPQKDGASDISRMETRKILFKALAMLDEDQRSILIATELEEKTFQEVSEETGIPLGTLLARKSRAMKKIKDFFK
jgi:RNA polymerase sigma factor (sigma-70 family)